MIGGDRFTIELWQKSRLLMLSQQN